MTRRLVIGLDEVVAPPPADFAVCALRSPADASDPLYPVPVPRRDAVALEDGDGTRLQSFPCTGIEVFDPRRRLRARPLAATVQLSDGRLIIASAPPRGGFLGGPIAFALNVGTRLRARDRMLVGHVRYGWIDAVYAQRKEGPFTPELVRVLVARADGTTAQVDLLLPGDIDAVAVAETLIRRAGLAPEPRLERTPGRVVGVARR